MATAMQARPLGASTQTSAKLVTATPEEIKSVLLADGTWHDVQNVEQIQFAISAAQSPTNPDKLYPALRCEEAGKSVVYPFRQIVGFSAEPGGNASQQGQNQGYASSR